MTIKELLENISDFEVVNISETEEKRGISGIYTCDLLSIVMGRAFEDCAWVTVMANVNSIAVAKLAEIGLVIFAEGVQPDEVTISKSKSEGINAVKTKLPVFDAALAIHKLTVGEV